MASAFNLDGGARLDLGCGFYKKAGFIGLDNLFGAESQRVTNTGPDVVVDMAAHGIPFPDESVIEIFTSHFLEHVPIDVLLKEMFRVLKPAGACQIIMPYANSAQGMYPGHLSFYTEQWFRENLLFQTLFCIERIGFRKTALYDQLPWTMRRKFAIARQVYFNICDEFTIFCLPRKRADVDYSKIVAEEFAYMA